MGFVTRKGEYFSGRVVEPDGDGEVVVVDRGTRSAVAKITVAEAERRNWDWVIELKHKSDDDETPVVTLAHWSSLGGELPPIRRVLVPGLN